MNPQPRISHSFSRRRSEKELVACQQHNPSFSPRLVVPTKETRCFYCGKLTKHPSAAFSTHCQNCHEYLKLDAVHLYPMSHKKRVRTRGDVFIKEDSHLQHLNIICNHLHMKGSASGSFQCHGTMYIDCATKIEGIIRAKRLMIAPNVEVSLRKQALVQECLILGTLIGNIQCTSIMKIESGGTCIGDVISPKLLLLDAAQHHGFWTRA